MNHYSSPASPATFDEEGLRHRVGGDEELMADVVRLFLEDLPARLIAIAEALTARDAEALRQTAHELKGAAGTLSVNALFEMARALESSASTPQMDGADVLWQRLSTEAGLVVGVLNGFLTSEKKMVSL